MSAAVTMVGYVVSAILTAQFLTAQLITAKQIEPGSLAHDKLLKPRFRPQNWRFKSEIQTISSVNCRKVIDTARSDPGSAGHSSTSSGDSHG